MRRRRNRLSRISHPLERRDDDLVPLREHYFFVTAAFLIGILWGFGLTIAFL